MSKSTFGERVIGHEAAAAALAAQKGGAEVFGKRVVNAIPEPTSFELAKRSSQFGAAVIDGAHESDTKGKPGSVSVEDLENILDENPTFFDSLYEAELARKEGPRTAALEVFLNVEYGIKGAGRQSIIAEINGMLGKTGITAKQAANELTARGKELRERQTRMDENASLQDAERVRVLRERDDNLAHLKGSKNKSTTEQLAAGTADTEAQRRHIAEASGLDIGQDPTKRGEPVLPAGVAAVTQGGGAGRGAHTDLKSTDTKPETQSQTERTSEKRAGVTGDTSETATSGAASKPAAKKASKSKSKSKSKK
jgi:hypothetical protein